MTDRPPEDRTTEDLVGRILAGKYRILQRLGEGAMGSVYLGEHLRFGRKDAIKVLQASMARDPEATRRFLRGARNVSAINHRNVCTVYDFGDTEDGHQFLAMEFVDGEALSDTLEREGALPAERAVRIVGQVASALQAAHDQGIVHRDLKPGNIMLTRDREEQDLVKVVDFDIAKGSKEGEGGEVTRLGFVVGTPEYMSPEQLTGDPLDGRSDVYSLGLVCFRLLTGRLPVRATSTQDLLVERLTQDPLTLRDVAPDPDFPPGLQAVLDRALQRRRDDRHATAVEFARDLEASLGGSAPAAVPTPRSAAQEPSPRLTATGARPVASSDPPGVPATRITDPGRVATPPSTPSAGTPAGEPGARRYLVWGLGAVALLAVGWMGYAALSGGGSDSTARPETGEPPTQEQTDPPIVDSNDSAVTPDPEGGDPPVRNTPGDDPVTDPPDDPVTDPPDDPVRPPDRETTRPALPFAVEDAEDVAFRQLDPLLVGGEVSDARLRAGIDTANLIARADEVTTLDRALANFVLGELQSALGDTAAAIGAYERAVRLNPDSEPYRTALEAIRGGRP